MKDTFLNMTIFHNANVIYLAKAMLKNQTWLNNSFESCRRNSRWRQARNKKNNYFKINFICKIK